MTGPTASVFLDGNVTDSNFSEFNSTLFSHVTQMTLQDDAFRSTEGISNTVIGTMMLLMNGLLITTIYSQRRHLNWKRFACILNLAVSDFICGVVLTVRGVTDLTCTKSTCPLQLLDKMLGMEVCVSIIMTILNYNCQLYIQYLAIKKPLFYHTKVTVTNLLKVIGVLWIGLLLYTTFKVVMTFWSYWAGVDIFFTILDAVAMGFSLFFNSMSYSYVLRIAAQKRKEILNRRSIKLSTSTSSCSESDTAPVIKLSVFSQYNSIITLGIQLITYIATITPLFIYWAYSSIYSISVYEPINVNGKTANAVLESFWFVRAILDPLTFLIRERQLLFPV